MLSKYDQKGSVFYRLITFCVLIATLFMSTAFVNLENNTPELANTEHSGIFYADTLLWSGEDQKVYVKGNVDVKAVANDFKGQGSFSFLGKVNLLMINGKKASLNTSIDISGLKCAINILSVQEAKEKYGADGSLGAVEINTLQ